MATTYQLKTFADLYNAVREELKIQSTDTTSIQRIQRDLNIIYLDEVVPFSNWRWLRGNLNVNVQAAFATGTASVTQNSATVTLSNAPGSSRSRYYFSVVGYNEIYRIQSHTANSTSIVLESPYTGSTNATASFKIWTDEIPLPADVRETTTITHDFQDIPLENCGLQKFRAYVAALPKAEGRPQFYTCETYSDPGYFVTNAALPAISTRASSTLQKTLVFAADVSSYLPQGTRFRIQTAGDSTYNGDYVVATQSGSTITYTGIYPLQESSTADATMSIQIAISASNDRRYKRLLIYPSINNASQMLHVDFLREVPPLVNDTDEPLMPIGDRVVLLYGALQRAWARERNPEEAERNQKMYEMKLSRMSGKVDDSIEPPRLQVNRVYLGAKRANTRQRSTMYGSFDGWGAGGSSGGANVQGTPNRVTVFDSSGNVTSSSVTTTELNRLSGVTSQVDGISDTRTLTNKTIDAASNTISNIANANVSATAAIAYSKLALTGSILNADIASGAGIVYSKLSLTNSIVNADIASAAGIVYSKLSLANSIVNADIATGAAVAYSKLNLSGSVTNADLAGSIAASKLVGSDIATVGTVTTGTWSATTIAINKGGTGQTTASAAFDALSPNTTKGDLTVRTSSTNARLAIGSDGQVPVADSTQTTGIKWATLQQGAKNYITYNNFENNATTGWSLSHTTLSSNVPNQVSGSWTSANGSLAFTSTSSGPLAGTYSGQLAWTGTTSIAGDMLVSQAYTIDTEDQAKVLAFKFYYSATVGSSLLNFSGSVNNTYQVYIYDVTNSAWIQPAGVYGMTQGSGVGYCTGTFQTPSNMTQFRIAIVCINASSSGSHTILFDDFTVGPQTAPLGPAMSDPVSFTPTISAGFGTATNVNCYWRRDGNMLEMWGTFTAGTVAASVAQISLPSGLSVDTTKIDRTSGQLVGAITSTAITGTAGAPNDASLFVKTTDTTVLSVCNVAAGASSNNLTALNVTAFNNNNTPISFWARLPISGWSSNVQMSNDTDTRVVAFFAQGTPGGSISSSDNQIAWPTTTNDTHGAYNSSTGDFTAPVSGYYCFSAGFRASATFAAGNTTNLRIKKNGSSLKSVNLTAYGAMGTAEMSLNIESVYLNAGDKIGMYSACSGTSPTYNSNTDFNWFSGMRISGPAVVAATETVAARYTSTSTATITSSDTVINYDTKDTDTHSAVTTGSSWKFTAPVSGRYTISAAAETSNTGATSTNSHLTLSLYKTGSRVCVLEDKIMAITGGYRKFVQGTRTIQMLAGDYFDIRISCTDATSHSLATFATDAFTVVEVIRSGNY